MAAYQLTEFDHSGSLIGTYHLGNDEPGACFDVTRQSAQHFQWQRLLNVFLPAGYPSSVTDDYTAYQIYDSLQAFSSSVAGMLANRAVLEGVGVGDASSDPTTALLLSVLQESFGRVATIVFADRLGSALEPECKMYRLAADVFNDFAMILDCLSPAFPKPTRIVLFSSSSVLRALCGVSAGSAKASLSAHFSKWGNLGEVSAKDSSQETVISLTGMLAGSLVVSWVSSPLATWITLLGLLFVHLSMNYAAVRSVQMLTLNRQRANLVFSHLLAYDKALTPKQVSQTERIFERDGVLRWVNDEVIGYAKFAVSIRRCLVHENREADLTSRLLGLGRSKSSRSSDPMGLVVSLIEMFQDEDYVLWYNDQSSKGSTKGNPTVFIALKQKCSVHSQLKAWLHALILARELQRYAMPNKNVPKSNETHQPSPSADEDSTTKSKRNQTRLGLISRSLVQAAKIFDEYASRLELAGWKLEHVALETHAGPRMAESLRR